jgi:hypothetical protein
MPGNRPAGPLVHCGPDRGPPGVCLGGFAYITGDEQKVLSEKGPMPE